MKRLVFCFDGTSNTLDRPHATNVAITAAAVKNSSKTGPQIVYYDEGVGTGDLKDKLLGGMAGKGLYDKVIEGYKFLVFNYEPGDEIFIFGFSRGAYTARSFAGLIQHVGVVNSCYADKIHVASALYRNRNQKAAVEELDDINRFRGEFAPDVCASEQDREWRRKHLDQARADQLPLVTIRYIGVWDTVKTIGDPMLGDGDGDGEYDAGEFHDHHLYPSVIAARHAVAIDERRKKFNVTLWDNVDELNRGRGIDVADPDRPYQQLWFPGDHGSVGGGGDIRGLSDEGLEWVLEGAKREGLEFDVSNYSKIWGIHPDVLASTTNMAEKSWDAASVIMRNLSKKDRVGPKAMHEVSTAAIIRWAAPPAEGRPRYRPEPLKNLSKGMDTAASAYQAWEFNARGSYEPADLPSPIQANGQTLRRYTIRSGETLEKIAKRELGDVARAPEILALNRTTILDPDRYYAGQIINLPSA